MEKLCNLCVHKLLEKNSFYYVCYQHHGKVSFSDITFTLTCVQELSRTETSVCEH